jgi:hypothetical protein
MFSKETASLNSAHVSPTESTIGAVAISHKRKRSTPSRPTSKLTDARARVVTEPEAIGNNKHLSQDLFLIFLPFIPLPYHLSFR